jgi:hypothetical protein
MPIRIARQYCSKIGLSNGGVSCERKSLPYRRGQLLEI